MASLHTVPSISPVDAHLSKEWKVCNELESRPTLLKACAKYRQISTVGQPFDLVNDSITWKERHFQSSSKPHLAVIGVAGARITNSVEPGQVRLN